MFIRNRKNKLLTIIVMTLTISSLTACEMHDPNDLEDMKGTKTGDLVIKDSMYKLRKESTTVGGSDILTDILRKMDEEKYSGIWNVTGDIIYSNADRGGDISKGSLEGIILGYGSNNYPREDLIAVQLSDTLPPIGDVVPPGTRVTSGWGIRKRHPVTGKTRAHDGMDFGTPKGTPITSAWDGTVTFVGWKNGYGKLLKIDHGSGVETRYAHLNDFRVKVGDKVTKNQVIAISGNTGTGTGAHLHLEIRYNGLSRNPYHFFKDKDVKNIIKYNTEGW